MSQAEPKTPNKTGASGAAWSDAEKIAYLIVLCEAEGKVDAKIAAAPIPAGRSIVSCKKLLFRLKEKHKDEIEKIKAGQPVAASGDATAKTPTPRKRKAKGETVGDGEGESSPQKKTGGRKKKTSEDIVVEDGIEALVKKEVKDEELEGYMEI